MSTSLGLHKQIFVGEKNDEHSISTTRGNPGRWGTEVCPYCSVKELLLAHGQHGDTRSARHCSWVLRNIERVVSWVAVQWPVNNWDPGLRAKDVVRRDITTQLRPWDWVSDVRPPSIFPQESIFTESIALLT